jgi:hypothetical protein
MELPRNGTDRKIEELSERTCPSTTLSITDPTWRTNLGANPALRVEKRAELHSLCSGTNSFWYFICRRGKELSRLTARRTLRSEISVRPQCVICVLLPVCRKSVGHDTVNSAKVKQSHNTYDDAGGRECIAPTHSRGVSGQRHAPATL